MSSRLDRVLSVITTICLVVVTGMVVHARWNSTQMGTMPMVGAEVDDWDVLISSGIREGSQSAPIQIVEFMDFQCPFCKTYHGTLDSIMAAAPGSFAVTYRHLPLSYHPAAPAAAALGHCAHQIGRFREVAAAIYQYQERLNDIDWETVLAELSAEESRGLRDCMFSDQASAAVRVDEAIARELQVTSTPTVFINGRRLNSPPPADSLRAFGARASSGGPVFPSSSFLGGLFGG